MIGTIIKHTAIFNGECLKHFGIHPMTAMLYGHAESDIIEVDMLVSTNQTINDHSIESKDPKADYWGWYDFENKRFTMIYAKRFLLNMCFPSGIEASENANQGKAYRLEYQPK